MPETALLENRTFAEIAPGDTASLERTLSQRDIELFAVLSGDANASVRLAGDAPRIVAHNMWGGILVSTLLGTKLPGPGTVPIRQDLNFLSAVGLGVA